ncbi:MAG: UDP-N-acetylglucosamine--N-acetylmuramyl-(pentapeptide) pyrophosphoryl-undecaprenol N-acetylglucosamine transferase [Armatimonadetes bacterium]|nr:UDP-N-acetylglucosamine--N-acetylmuramyl-(pentapeptide) pyrophosphoryl-undecaprenol N-acetylglucosamine transferase [Armatimonadota bacterium]
MAMVQPLRVLLAGGGTGGHIYPLLSLAAELRTRFPAAAVRFAGEAGRMEAELVAREGWDLTLLRLPPANAPAWRRVLAAPAYLAGYREAARLLADFRPDVVLGSGGQVCAPVLLAARRQGTARVILEPNAIPGRANRWLAAKAAPDLVGILIPMARDYFPGVRVEELGYPIRPEILRATREQSARELGLDPSRPTVLVFGGSLGSGRINEALVGLLPNLHEPWAKALQVLHLGGRVNARTIASEAVSNLSVAYHYRDYLHEMELALAAADLVVGRAGAMSLAELTARGLPAVLVPFPGAADDHQRHNAAWMAAAGGAVVVPDSELTPARLGQELAALLTEPSRLAAMAASSLALGKPAAASSIVERMVELAARGG